MQKILLASFLCLVHISVIWAQERSVTGKVTAAEDGVPLPGVNVVVKGTSLGTVTNTAGIYTLNVPANSTTLVFSFIGLTTQEIEIGARTTVDLQMAQDVQQLGEVVVTAVGIQRERKALGYSVETVDGNKVQQVSEPDPLRALTGKVPGLKHCLFQRRAWKFYANHHSGQFFPVE